MEPLRALAVGLLLGVACETEAPPTGRAPSPGDRGGPSASEEAPPGRDASEGDARVRLGSVRVVEAEPRGTPVPAAEVHLLGRVDTRAPAAPRVGYPGSQIRGSFEGQSLVVTLADSGASQWSVRVDDVERPVLIASGGARAYEIASGLDPGLHDFVMTKRTETFVGVTTLLDVAAGPGGRLVATPVPSGRRLELIGDSITCGFGVLGRDATCPFSPDTESEPDAWAARAAEALSALHTSVCWSGLGVYRNYQGDPSPTMPQRYDLSIADDPTSAWAPAVSPDVVVVALGTNDFAGGQGDPGTAFADAYTTFLEKLRARHPSAALVLATSPMLGGNNRLLHRAYLVAARKARAAAGDTRVSILDLDEQDENDGMGCGYHPNRTTQGKMAAKLVAHLEATLGW